MEQQKKANNRRVRRWWCDDDDDVDDGDDGGGEGEAEKINNTANNMKYRNTRIVFSLWYCSTGLENMCCSRRLVSDTEKTQKSFQ